MSIKSKTTRRIGGFKHGSDIDKALDYALKEQSAFSDTNGSSYITDAERKKAESELPTLGESDLSSELEYITQALEEVGGKDVAERFTQALNAIRNDVEIPKEEEKISLDEILDVNPLDEISQMGEIYDKIHKINSKADLDSIKFLGNAGIIDKVDTEIYIKSVKKLKKVYGKKKFTSQKRYFNPLDIPPEGFVGLLYLSAIPATIGIVSYLSGHQIIGPILALPTTTLLSYCGYRLAETFVMGDRELRYIKSVNKHLEKFPDRKEVAQTALEYGEKIVQQLKNPAEVNASYNNKKAYIVNSLNRAKNYLSPSPESELTEDLKLLLG
jgi:hypothetical protein